MTFMKRLFIYLLLATAPQLAHAQFAAQQTWCTSTCVSGTANAIVLSIPGITTSSDAIGVPLRFVVESTNTSAVTASVGTAPIAPIMKNTPSGIVALSGGELRATNTAVIMFDGTEYVITSAITPPTITGSSIQFFATNGTYTPSPGIRGIYVQCWAGGGGGGFGNSSGGGGGGEYRAGTFPPPASPITVTIGTGGGIGGSGTLSSFGTLLLALPGGSGGAGSPGGAGGVGGSGGAGGNVSVHGSPGGSGFTDNLDIFIGGSGGSAFQSSGTSINIGAIANPGVNGSFPGGGASGSNFSGAGGVGAGGACEVQEL